MKILCNRYNVTFTKYVYQPVIWSGDQVPCCPCCGDCVYDVDYQDYHQSLPEPEDEE